MQKPKYDKDKPLPIDLVDDSLWYSSDMENVTATAHIYYHYGSQINTKQIVTAGINETPMQIYDRVSTKPLGIGKFRVTFASVHFLNVTVQVV